MNTTRWVFIARAFPERLPIKVAVPIKSTSNYPGFALSFELVVQIADSQIIAHVSVTEGDTDIQTLKNLVEAKIRIILDIAGYQFGGSFDVEVISVIGPSNETSRVFGNTIPVLMNMRREDYGVIDGELLRAVDESYFASRVLADFREAMRMPYDTGFFCYRAIETMMQSMRPVPDKKKATAQDWCRLHSALKIKESYIRLVQNCAANDARHGHLVNISDHERADVFKVTYTIINRYLTYIVRGSQPLPETDFPWLDQ